MSERTNAVAALAHRFRLAATETWDGDRCDTEAAAYVGELIARGWTPGHPRALTTRHDPDPEDVRRRVATLRGIARAAAPQPAADHEEDR
jgi:hypothetical protein